MKYRYVRMQRKNCKSGCMCICKLFKANKNENVGDAGDSITQKNFASCKQILATLNDNWNKKFLMIKKKKNWKKKKAVTWKLKVFK